ncbi:MAG: DUF2073 domain-containing protein [Thermoplasmata archaeon]|nr:MAG: DUF2073 domain-containing protein [Thermoplasmata archaeon]
MAQNAGISINLISIERLAQMGSRDKIRFILNEVRRGNVLVLERGLTANEEAELIKTTMANIDHKTFIGIEMQSYSHEDVKKGSWLSKLLGRKQPPRMSVIGPADLLKTVHKDGNMIQAMILTRESIVGEGKGQKKPLPAPPQGKKMPQEAANKVTPNTGAQPQSSNSTSSESKDEESDTKENKGSEGD